MAEFQPNPRGQNELLQGDDFYVSFLPGDRERSELLTQVEEMAALLSCDSSLTVRQAETALRKKGDSAWYILNGDFRKEYEGLVEQGWEACLAFYHSQEEDFRSPWSTAPRVSTSSR